jgi:hypothetical protein
MGRLTWEELLQSLVDVRDDNENRGNPNHDATRRDNLEFIVQTILEKLKDDPRRFGS